MHAFQTTLKSTSESSDPHQKVAVAYDLMANDFPPDLKMTELLNIVTILFTDAESFQIPVCFDCVICNARPIAINFSLLSSFCPFFSLSAPEGLCSRMPPS